MIKMVVRYVFACLSQDDKSISLKKIKMAQKCDQIHIMPISLQLMWQSYKIRTESTKKWRTQTNKPKHPPPIIYSENIVKFCFWIVYWDRKSMLDNIVKWITQVSE